MNELIELDFDLKNLYCVYSSSDEETTVEEYQHNNISVTIENSSIGANISINENYTNYPVVITYVAKMLENEYQEFDIDIDYVTSSISFSIYTSPSDVEELIEKIDKFIGFLEV